MVVVLMLIPSHGAHFTTQRSDSSAKAPIACRSARARRSDRAVAVAEVVNNPEGGRELQPREPETVPPPSLPQSAKTASRGEIAFCCLQRFPRPKRHNCHEIEENHGILEKCVLISLLGPCQIWLKHDMTRLDNSW